MRGRENNMVAFQKRSQLAVVLVHLQDIRVPRKPSTSFPPFTLPYRLFVRHLSESRYCQDNETPFHHFTTYIVSFANALHIQFIFKE